MPEISTRRAHAAVGALLAFASIASLLTRVGLGDYPTDAGPAITALVHGRVGDALAHQPLMGSLAVLARVPFALAAVTLGAGERGVYQAGVVPCIAALAALGLLLVRLRPELPALTLLLVPVLTVLTPASFAAVQAGHPEEALAAALAVAAVVLAPRRALTAGVLLGLALATKQWTILAVAPAIVAAPRGARLKLLGVAVAIGAALTVPLLAANPSSYLGTAHNAAGSSALASRETVWFLLAHPTRVALHLGAGFPSSLTVYRLDGWMPAISHPLIVLASPLLALLVWRKRQDPLALLALVFLLRCVLDPADNTYYHLPLLAALLAYEVLGKRSSFPALTVFATAGLWLTAFLDGRAAAPPLTNAVYLVWVSATALYLLRALDLTPRPARRHIPVTAALARQRA